MQTEEIRKKKLSQLFAIASKVGYKDNDLREIASIQVGVESLRALNVDQLKQIIASIQKAHPSQLRSKSNSKNRPKTQPRPKLLGVKTLPSAGQKEKVVALSIQIRSHKTDFSVDQIALRMFKKPVSGLDFHQYQSLIEALKAILGRVSS